MHHSNLEHFLMKHYVVNLLWGSATRTLAGFFYLETVKIALSYEKAAVSRDREHNIQILMLWYRRYFPLMFGTLTTTIVKKHIPRSFESTYAVCFCYGKPNHFASKCRFRGYKYHNCNKLGHLCVMCHLHNPQGNVMWQNDMVGDFKVEDQDNHPEQDNQHTWLHLFNINSIGVQSWFVKV
ncbi:hypothetical protein PR048_012213 [Dryococelus australis]|uniref:Uncharacterized protein n=1 Tax=Dryococelus australis TaxID=614101 RepID=A0ABQ9HNS9_9NEOP|nr:hypothetical protein PR048_012213 [Dryococelus australis]